jgi:hypothetical protein
MFTRTNSRKGDLKWGAAAWLIGMPIPIIILALLFGGSSCSSRAATPAQVVPVQSSLR